ncbi:MAG TPA: hypothetical protein VM073_08635 [Usitatibacter sp.]|nr:hypothetical protein [Usitatibacter sp.]
MTAEGLIPALLLLQGVMGGVDTLVNHEMIARLPRRPEARPEIGLHSVRETIYATLFVGLAWWQWHGAAALAIAALVVAEIGVTASDEFLENRLRVLPQNERVLHVFLTLNLGAIVALLVPVLLDWSARSTALAPASHGIVSWLLTVLAAVAAFWSLRDLLAWRRLGKLAG